MENCLAELKARLGLFLTGRVRRHFQLDACPPSLLWFPLCSVCLFSWPILLPGRLSSLVYDSGNNVWIWSLTLVWFLEGAEQHLKKTMRNW